MRAAFEPFRTLGRSFAQSADHLWNILINATTDQKAGECIFVLDGLDECEPEDRRELIRKVSAYYLSYQSNDKATVKFLLTSRPYRTINESFQDLIEKSPHVHLSADQETAAIRKEIDIVVDHRVHILAESLNLNEETSNALAIKLKAAENRTYLWLRLIFEVIEQSRASSKRELDRWIETVPSTVQEAYAAILNGCENPWKAHTIFEIVLAAQSPLTVGELNIALACTDMLDTDDAENDDGECLDLDAHDVFSDKIRHICGLFVSIIDDRIYFIHKTARDFLTDQGVKEHVNSAITLPLSVANCHLTLAKSCTTYLLRNARTGLQESEKEFLRYSSRSWEAHVALGCLSDGANAFEELYEASLTLYRSRESWWCFRVSKAVHNPVDEDGVKRLPGRRNNRHPIIWRDNAEDEIETPTARDWIIHEGQEVVSEDPPQNSYRSYRDYKSPKPFKESKTQITTDDTSQETTLNDLPDADAHLRANIIALSFFGLVAMTWLAGVQCGSRPKRSVPRPTFESVIMQWTILYPSNAPARLSLWLREQFYEHPTNSVRPDSAYRVSWEPNYLSDTQIDSIDSASNWNNTRDLLSISESIHGSLVDILLVRPFHAGTEVEYSLDADSSLETLTVAFKKIASSAAASKKNIETYSQLLQRASEIGLLREWVFRLKDG